LFYYLSLGLFISENNGIDEIDKGKGTCVGFVFRGNIRLTTTPKPSRPRALFSFCLFHFLDDGFSDSIYILLPFIAAELRLSYSGIGLLRGISYGSTGVFQYPLSVLGERMGEALVILLGTFGTALGFLLLSKAHTFLTVLLSLLAAKTAGAGQHGLGSSVLSKVFEDSLRRAAMGTYNFSGDLGKVCVPFLLTLMINRWGWRDGLLFLSLGGLGVIALTFPLVFRQKVPLPLSRSTEEGSSRGNGWSIGWEHRKRFYALLTIGIIDIAARYALLTFLPFILLQKGVPKAEFGFALTLLFVGGAVGKFVCGLLAEWVGVLPMVVGTELLTTIGILSLTVLPTFWIWIVLPFLGIVLNGTSSVLYATVAEIIPSDSRSRGYGIYYAVTLGMGSLSPLFFGFLTDAFGLYVTLTTTALMVLVTLPLSRYISSPKKATIGF